MSVISRRLAAEINFPGGGITPAEEALRNSFDGTSDDIVLGKTLTLQGTPISGAYNEALRNNFTGDSGDILTGESITLAGITSAGTLVVTGGVIPIPATPTITNAVSYSSTVNNVKWNFVPLAEWYDLYKDGVKINTIAITGVEYLDQDVDADVTYGYTVKALNRSGSSSASDPYTVTTLTDTSKTTAIKVNESTIDDDSEITRT